MTEFGVYNSMVSHDTMLFECTYRNCVILQLFISMYGLFPPRSRLSSFFCRSVSNCVPRPSVVCPPLAWVDSLSSHSYVEWMGVFFPLGGDSVPAGDEQEEQRGQGDQASDRWPVEEGKRQVGQDQSRGPAPPHRPRKSSTPVYIWHRRCILHTCICVTYWDLHFLLLCLTARVSGCIDVCVH